MIQVSFDFDSTLDRQQVQDYAQSLLNRGIDVYVITSRYDELHKHKYTCNPTNDDLYKVTEKLGIPRWKIRFTCMKLKSEYIDGTNLLWHLDDDWVELNHINKETNTKGISVVGGNGWKNKCERLITKRLENTI